MNYTKRLLALREDNDYNQTTVAKAIHVAQTTYSDYENGKVRIPLECLIELTKLYNVDMNYISGISNVEISKTNKSLASKLTIPTEEPAIHPKT